MILTDDRTDPARLPRCTAHIWGAATGLVCTRRDVHDPDARGGHTYAGSDCPDGKHDDPAVDQ